MSSTNIRVLSWNIHGFVGLDGKYDPVRTGQVIDSISPDIAAFQEVDCRGDKAARNQTADSLREAVGDHSHYAWSIVTPDRHYGQMLASRYPIQSGKIHDISMDSQEPRRIIEAVIQAGKKGRIRVLATHLGLKISERRHQNAILRRLIASERTLPLVVMGDFNNWLMERRKTGLAGVMTDRTGLRTFPSRFPLLPLDRIWSRAPGTISQARTYPEYRQASDHLPLTAEIRFPVS
ncbi:MAG: endonuclease/exonuclease/phosphatase family protein [Rhodospirillales bacterium]